MSLGSRLPAPVCAHFTSSLWAIFAHVHLCTLACTGDMPLMPLCPASVENKSAYPLLACLNCYAAFHIACTSASRLCLVLHVA